jgi:hypothetical protein
MAKANLLNNNICSLTAVVFLIASMAGCSTPAHVLKVETEKDPSITSFVAKPDFGRVYFTNGNIIGFNIFNHHPVHRHSSDISINSVLIGSMNFNDVMVLDILPGDYKISWNVRSTDLILKQTQPSTFNFSIGSGEIKILKGDFDNGAGNLLGTLYNPPKTSVTESERKFFEGKNFVTPQTCPSTICN